MATLISSMETSIKICEALGLDSNMVRRIVLDFNLQSPVIAYIEMYGDKRLLDIQWSLDGAKIEQVSED